MLIKLARGLFITLLINATALSVIFFFETRGGFPNTLLATRQKTLRSEIGLAFSRLSPTSIDSKANSVGDLRLYYWSDTALCAPIIGEVMIRFGNPDWVVFGSRRGEGTYWLVYRTLDGWLIITAHHRGLLSPAHPVQFVRVTAQLPRGLAQGLQWQGFGSVEHYF